MTGMAVGLGGIVFQGCVESMPEVVPDVRMSASAFLPYKLEVKVGQTLKFVNTNSRLHTVTAYENKIPEGADYFASGGFGTEIEARKAWVKNLGGALATGEVFEHTFSISGTYHYFCIPHEMGGMMGIIEVTD
tara:strand:- start:1341 stop:1739 length:399 start_codon:yes stop_codon:yes gene_type:complete